MTREGLAKHGVIDVPADAGLILQKVALARQHNALDPDVFLRNAGGLMARVLEKTTSPQMQNWIIRCALRMFTYDGLHPDRDADLIAAMLKPGADEESHLNAAIQLTKQFGIAEALPVLRDGIESDNPDIRFQSLAALNDVLGPWRPRFRPEQVEEFIPLLEGYVGQADPGPEGAHALRALGVLAPGTKGAVEAAAQLAFSDRDPAERANMPVLGLLALQAYGSQAGAFEPQLEELIAKHAKDDPGRIGSQATTTLEAIRKAGTRDDLRATVDKGGTKDALAKLGDALGSSDAETRATARAVVQDLVTSESSRIAKKALKGLIAPLLARVGSKEPDLEGIDCLRTIGLIDPSTKGAAQKLADVAFASGSFGTQKQQAAFRALGAYGRKALPFRDQLIPYTSHMLQVDSLPYAAQAALNEIAFVSDQR